MSWITTANVASFFTDLHGKPLMSNVNYEVGDLMSAEYKRQPGRRQPEIAP
jgi:hypothetical protein